MPLRSTVKLIIRRLPAESKDTPARLFVSTEKTPRSTGPLGRLNNSHVAGRRIERRAISMVIRRATISAMNREECDSMNITLSSQTTRSLSSSSQPPMTRRNETKGYPRLDLRSRPKPAPALLAEAAVILDPEPGDTFKMKTTGQPYSIPEPEKWAGLAKRKQQKPIEKSRPEAARKATWYADCATRPVLLTFDANGTLFEPKESIALQYCEVARQFGLELAESDVQRTFILAYGKMMQEHPNYGLAAGMTPREWWGVVIHNTITPLLPEDTNIPLGIIPTLYRRFATSEGYKLCPGVRDFLNLLGTAFQAGVWAPRRTMLGIVSNSDPRVRSILESFNIQIRPSLYPPRFTPHSRHQSYDFGPAHFAFATLSSEVGNAKPSPAIYVDASVDAQIALDSLHAAASLTRSGNEVLRDIHSEFYHMHVGDSLDKDVIPALENGWDAILLDRQFEQLVGSMTIKGGREVTVIKHLRFLRYLLTKERIESLGRQHIRRPDTSQRQLKRKRPTRIRYEGVLGRRLVDHPASTVELPLKTYV